MLLGQKTIKLPLRHSETLSAPALDLFQKRVFQNNIISKVEKSARRPAPASTRRNSLEVVTLNESLLRMQRRDQQHESERKVPRQASRSNLTRSKQIKVVPHNDSFLASHRRSSFDSDGGTVLCLRYPLPSAVRDSIDEDYLASDASSSDRSFMPTQRPGPGSVTDAADKQQFREPRFYIEDSPPLGARHKSSENSINTRCVSIRGHQQQKHNFMLHYPDGERSPELSLESESEFRSQQSRPSPVSLPAETPKAAQVSPPNSRFRLTDRANTRQAAIELEYARLKGQKCLIMPSNPWKLRWDLIISVLIVASCFYTPYRLAFIDSQNLYLSVLEGGIDIVFAIDIALTFCSAYYDAQDVLIDRRQAIACNYLKFWFFLDLLSVIPISVIVNHAATAEMKGLARIMRLTRMHKMVKMVKLIRMLRLIKQRAQLKQRVARIIRSSINTERLVFFFLIFLVLCHVSACLWYLIAKLQDFGEDTWVMRKGFEAESPASLYMVGFYFTITTITTVGYGDVSAGTFAERLFCVCLMLIGAVSYSFAISSFASLIASLDSKQAKLKQKLDLLNAIRCEYDMDFEMYWKLRQALYFDHSKDMTDKMQLLNELPPILRVGLSDIMYRKHVKGIPYFKEKSPHFMATLGPLLRPVIVQKGEFIYLEGDPIDAIYFVQKGELGYIQQQQEPPDFIYHTIGEGAIFGDADFIQRDCQEPLRNFSVKAMSDVELLLLQKTDLYQIGPEFTKEIRELFSKSSERMSELTQLKIQGGHWYMNMLTEPKDESPASSSQRMRPAAPKKSCSLFQQNMGGPRLKKSFTVIQEGPEMDAENDNNDEETTKHGDLAESETALIDPSVKLSDRSAMEQISPQPEIFLNLDQRRNLFQRRNSAMEETIKDFMSGVRKNTEDLTNDPIEKESVSSLRRVIEKQLVQTTQQFNQIKNSLTEVVQLKQLLTRNLETSFMQAQTSRPLQLTRLDAENSFRRCSVRSHMPPSPRSSLMSAPYRDSVKSQFLDYPRGADSMAPSEFQSIGVTERGSIYDCIRTEED